MIAFASPVAIVMVMVALAAGTAVGLGRTAVVGLGSGVFVGAKVGALVGTGVAVSATVGTGVAALARVAMAAGVSVLTACSCGVMVLGCVLLAEHADKVKAKTVNIRQNFSNSLGLTNFLLSSNPQGILITPSV
jgi:hypothetical protein